MYTSNVKCPRGIIRSLRVCHLRCAHKGTRMGLKHLVDVATCKQTSAIKEIPFCVRWGSGAPKGVFGSPVGLFHFNLAESSYAHNSQMCF
jgi:hypothetical protein